MTRIELPQKQVQVVSYVDFLSDFKRGFCVLEYNPARTETIRDPRGNREIKRELPADLAIRCMRCEFDTLAGFVTVKKGQRITGEFIIQQHLERGEHPWAYSAFSTPYGRVSDVIIEGIDGEYAEYIKSLKGE